MPLLVVRPCALATARSGNDDGGVGRKLIVIPSRWLATLKMQVGAMLIPKQVGRTQVVRGSDANITSVKLQVDSNPTAKKLA